MQSIWELGVGVWELREADDLDVHAPDVLDWYVGGIMDEDLDRMSATELIAEVKKLREGIRKHRDSTGHELCWHHPDLWALLPERTDPVPTVPTWPVFLRGCLRYRESLDQQIPNAPRSDAPYRA